MLRKDIEELNATVLERNGRITRLLDVKLSNENTIEQLQKTLAELKKKLFESGEQSNQQIYYLNDELTLLKNQMKETSERDQKTLEHTLLQLRTEHEIVLDSIKEVMMEERETEMNDLKNKYVELERKSE